MPLPLPKAAIRVPSAEEAIDCQLFTGAVADVQFVPASLFSESTSKPGKVSVMLVAGKVVVPPE